MATAAPAFAVSGGPTLAFMQSSYSGTACDTITGVEVKKTTDGVAAAANATVTVTLTDGYAFPGGATTYTGTTNASGVMTLPPISVPAWGGNSGFSAVSGALNASAGAAVPAGLGTAYYRAQNGTTAAYTSVPKGATAVGHAAFLAPNGDLYVGNTLVASNVTSAFGDVADSGNATVVGYMQDGVAKYYSSILGTSSTYPDVPSNATPVGRNVFLGAGGQLFVGNNLLASGVTSATARMTAVNRINVSYVNASGGRMWVQSGPGFVGSTTTFSAVPSTAVSVGGTAFLGSGGARGLWVDNALVATGVTSAYGDININDNTVVGYMKDGKAYYRAENGGATAERTAVPSTAVPTGSHTFLPPNGNLRQGDTLIATHVTSATSRINFNNMPVVGYVAADVCH